MVANNEHWSSRIGFIFATIGSAVGLGSIWKFPYEVGTNGGGAFVLFYLGGLVLIVVPLILVEFAIGRRGHSDAIGSVAAVAVAQGRSRWWALIGALGVVSAFLILSFYAVIGGWALAYTVDMLVWGLPPADPAVVQARFDALLAAPGRMVLFHALFMAIAAVIVGRGIADGIEVACKVLMPLLIVLMILLAMFAVAKGGFLTTFWYLFALDTAKITPQVALEALGLGFFSIGVGLGIMIVYAAYAEKAISLTQVAIVVVLGDTAISFLAGFAIFPIVFSEALDPSSGPGLMFVTLPLAFARMPFGFVAAFAFFLLLTVAALASAISMLEMPVALAMRHLRWTRRRATLVMATACFVVGLASVFSFNLWRGFYPLALLPGFRQATLYDVLDHLTSNLLLPVGGFALAILAGWVLPPTLLARELRLSENNLATLRMVLRYIVPAGILAATLGPILP
jgi:NSS family neurotransmitter:Na+ symporter